ncbi:MAG: hypothetical protein AAFO58_08460 [Pseudomonadota bacterium]
MMIDRDISSGPVVDLADFYTRWPQLRDHAVSVLDRPDLTDAEREVLVWLTALADKIGPVDIEAS